MNGKGNHLCMQIEGKALYEWNGYEARKFVYNCSVLEGWKCTVLAMDFICKTFTNMSSLFGVCWVHVWQLLWRLDAIMSFTGSCFAYLQN